MDNCLACLPPELSRWRGTIEQDIEATRAAIARLIQPAQLTVEIEHAPPTKVIPELGMVGYCHGPTTFSLRLDPRNPHFASTLSEGALRRQVAHEAHHCFRNAGRGYGDSLGEAFVSEGLAGHFVHRLFGTPPEPWECALEEAVALRLMPDATALAATDYDHNSWFFGMGSTYPRWLGYTLGYVIVGRSRSTGRPWSTSPQATFWLWSGVSSRDRPRLQAYVRFRSAWATHARSAGSSLPGRRP